MCFTTLRNTRVNGNASNEPHLFFTDIKINNKSIIGYEQEILWENIEKLVKKIAIPNLSSLDLIVYCLLCSGNFIFMPITHTII